MKIRLSLTGLVTLGLALVFGGCQASDELLSSGVTGAAHAENGVKAGGKEPTAETVARLPIGEITTVAGGSPLPTNASPTSVALLGICGIAVDQANGNVYISDSIRHVVLKINAAGTSLTKVAGIGRAGFNGDGRAAVETAFHVPCQLALDPDTGDLYVADVHNYRVRKISATTKTVSTVAGNGVPGIASNRMPTEPPFGPGLSLGKFSGDGGPATAASLNLPAGIAFAANDVLYVSDSGNSRVRAVNLSTVAQSIAGKSLPAGAIQTIAGDGTPGSGGDGGPATSAQLIYPKNLALDSGGHLLIADPITRRLRQVDTSTGIIKTIYDSGSARSPVHLIGVEGIALTGSGDILFSDLAANVIQRISQSDASNALTTGQPVTPSLVAGVGVSARATDGSQANRAPLSAPAAMAVGPQNEIYVVDGGNCRLLRIKNGELSVFAGGGSPGDGVAATDAVFSVLAPIASGPGGNLYIGDASLHTIRKIDLTTGTIANYAGTGNPRVGKAGGTLRQTPFVEAFMSFTPGDEFAIDPASGLVRLVTGGVNKTLAAFAGNGNFGATGEGGPATDAALSLPIGLEEHPLTGEHYITNLWIPRISKVDSAGIITRFAGSGEEGFGGDGGPALNARFHWPSSLEFDSAGNLFVADFFNNRIRKISTTGTITTFAGTGSPGFSGDGGPAKDADIWRPNDMEISNDYLYFTDVNNHRVRKISLTAPHTISTVAGTGVQGFSGDGGPAVNAELATPRGITISDGVLYITDSLNGRVRAVRLQ